MEEAVREGQGEPEQTTERLYYQLPYVKIFSAKALWCQPNKKGSYDVVLDRTGFYPEGGGQPSDTGTLAGIRVLSVHERGGRIVHQLEAPVALGETLEGRLDWLWRYDNMQQHTGEHILSGLIHKRFGYDNVGFHMGRDAVTIDFNGELTAQELERVEEEANERIYENIPVETLYPSSQELERMEYRSKKELSGQVRIIRIGDSDTCACCGTHVETTGEIGLIKALSMIRYKGGVRIWMLCGRRAFMDYRRKQESVTRISNLLSAKPELVADAVARLKEEQEEKARAADNLYRQVLEQKVRSFPDAREPLLLFEPELAPMWLRIYCTMLYEQKKGDVVLVCSGDDRAGTYQYALGSGLQDMRELSRAMNQALNGRGGGSALMAQGSFKAERSCIERQFNQLLMEE